MPKPVKEEAGIWSAQTCLRFLGGDMSPQSKTRDFHAFVILKLQKLPFCLKVAIFIQGLSFLRKEISLVRKETSLVRKETILVHKGEAFLPKETTFVRKEEGFVHDEQSLFPDGLTFFRKGRNPLQKRKTLFG